MNRRDSIKSLLLLPFVGKAINLTPIKDKILPFPIERSVVTGHVSNKVMTFDLDVNGIVNKIWYDWDVFEKHQRELEKLEFKFLDKAKL